MRKLCYLFEHVKLCMRNMLTAFDGVRRRRGGGEGRKGEGREQRVAEEDADFGRGEGRRFVGVVESTAEGRRGV